MRILISFVCGIFLGYLCLSDMASAGIIFDTPIKLFFYLYFGVVTIGFSACVVATLPNQSGLFTGITYLIGCCIGLVSLYQFKFYNGFSLPFGIANVSVLLTGFVSTGACDISKVVITQLSKIVQIRLVNSPGK